MIRNRSTVVAVTVVTLLALATPAVALNTHTVPPHWYMGLGDGKNDNFYVHPFVDDQAGQSHYLYVDIHRGATFLAGKDCVCQHIHYFWDTSPYKECRYWTHVDSGGDHGFNTHSHDHHNPC